MKPKPFSALNHFTVPCATCAPTFVRAVNPPASEGSGLALPPVGHERGTRTARNGTARIAAGHGSATCPITRCGNDYDSADQARFPDRAERRLHPVGGGDDGGDRLQGLEALAGVEDDGLLGRVEPAVLHELPQHRGGDAARGLGEDAGGAGQVPDALHDRRVADPAGRGPRTERPCTIAAPPPRPTDPPVRRIASRAYGPSAGLPMFSDLAMPVGLTGLPSPHPLSMAVAIGSQRADWAPKTFQPLSSTMPAAVSSRQALSTLVSSEPDAIGMTTWAGIRQPSCSAIS